MLNLVPLGTPYLFLLFIEIVSYLPSTLLRVGPELVEWGFG